MISRPIDYLELPAVFTTIIYVIFGSVFVIVEEIIIAYQIFIDIRKVQCNYNLLHAVNEDGNPIQFEDLSLEDQNVLRAYYDAVDFRNKRKK